MSETVVDRSPSGGTAPPDRFACVLSYGGSASVWVRLVGPLDLTTAPQLELILRRAHRRVRLIVLDLRELTSLDSAGVDELLRADTRARRSSDRLVIVNVPAHVRGLTELTQLTQLLEIADDPGQVGTIHARAKPSRRSAPAPFGADPPGRLSPLEIRRVRAGGPRAI